MDICRHFVEMSEDNRSPRKGLVDYVDAAMPPLYVKGTIVNRIHLLLVDCCKMSLLFSVGLRCDVILL